jgi:hypothetical protein
MRKLILLPFLSLFFLASAEGQHRIRASTIYVTYEPERLQIDEDGAHGYRLAYIHNDNNFAVDVTFFWNGWSTENRDTNGQETVSVSANGEEFFGGHGGDSFTINKVWNLRATPSE